MDKYYYIIAQLPTLYFDRESFLTIESFLREAKKWMRSGEYRFLSSIDLYATSPDKRDPRMWREFKKRETRFREELAQWRRSRREGKEIKKTAFPVHLVKEGNPLDVEKKLLKYRWEYIEELEKVHHFDLEFLILYFLKLQILRRLALFEKEKGEERYRDVVTADYRVQETEETVENTDGETRETDRAKNNG
jgi:hypothetical protein